MLVDVGGSRGETFPGEAVVLDLVRVACGGAEGAVEEGGGGGEWHGGKRKG